MEPLQIRGEPLRKGHYFQKEDLKVFLDNCCTLRHCSVVIKKYGSFVCSMCQPPRLPIETFSSLHVLPDPMPGEEEQYKAFREVYGTDTNESHRPSLEKKSTVKTLLFSSTIRHIQNADIMPECEQCGRWRLLYSQYKLTNERTVLENELEEISFTCGSPLQDLDLPGKLPKVYA